MKIDNIRKIIKEALGVPDNLYETAVDLYNRIIPKFNNFDIDLLDENDTFRIGFQGKFRIADFEFSKVFITFHFEHSKKLKSPEIVGMSVESQSQRTPDMKLKMLKQKTLKLNVRMFLPEEYNYGMLQDFIKSERNDMIESLSHELKHSYNAFKKIYDNPYERALYSGVSGKRFGIWPIDRFFHDIYYTTVNESLVRPSEVAAAIRNNNISQKDFLKFLYDTDTYKNLKRLSEFSYEKFKSEIAQKMDRVNLLLKHIGGYKLNKMSDEEKIDEVLRLVMVNVANWTIDEFKEILTSNFLEELIGFEGEKERIFKRFMHRYQKYKTPEEFFRFYEKLFNHVGNNMIRKIAKLYAITNKG